VYIYHNFLILSSVVGHLGCFQSIVIVNSAVMNIGVQVSLLCLVLLLGRCPGVVSLDHIAILSLVFWGNSILFCIVIVLIFIPTSSVEGFLFYHILTRICCRSVFLLWPEIWSIYSCVFFFGHLNFFLRKSSVRFICPFIGSLIFGSLVF
jgi:hypothetical protein